MIAVKGFYENGEIKIPEPPSLKKKTEVIIIFLEQIEETPLKKINLNDFSFKKAREQSKDYKGSLSDAVIEERRSYQ